MYEMYPKAWSDDSVVLDIPQHSEEREVPRRRPRREHPVAPRVQVSGR